MTSVAQTPSPTTRGEMVSYFNSEDRSQVIRLQTTIDDLKEYLSVEEGQDTSLSYDDINCTDEDIYGGEVQVEGKEVVVHNLRIKPEVVDLLGLKKD